LTTNEILAGVDSRDRLVAKASSGGVIESYSEYYHPDYGTVVPIVKEREKERGRKKNRRTSYLSDTESWVSRTDKERGFGDSL